MKDHVVDSYLNSFVESFGYQSLKESEQFERFCFFSLLNDKVNYSLNSDDLDSISVGENKGIDGISFIINGKLIKDIKDIEDIKLNKQKSSINVYFIQCKRSENFEDTEIGGFLDTVIDFLQKELIYSATEETENYHEIYQSILDDLRLVKEFTFTAYYCCPGVWNEGTSCSTTIDNKKKIIESKELFDKIEIVPIDKSSLLAKYKIVSNPITAEFEFSNKLTIKDIKGVEESYIGLLPFHEFKKLIVDPNNGKLRSLFYDNVRDFLGLDNKVNEKIQLTLKSKNFSEFSLLNNGITIIASENNGRADKFILNNYQIVNGCQTSNVLYECREIEGVDTTIIPVKVIITKDELLRDKIILSTNNQSRIEEEELLALTNFQKQLEEYYANSKDGIFYERRNNQYLNNPEIKKKSIVDIREQIKSFVAMFLNEPHDVSGYFGRVYRSRKNEIFVDGHLFEPYYISGLIQFKFKEFLNSQLIERKYNKIRYHIFMIFRLLQESENFQKDFLKNKKKKNYFVNLLDSIRDKDKCLETFKNTFSLIEISGIKFQEQKEIYKKSTTNTLLENYKKSYK